MSRIEIIRKKRFDEVNKYLIEPVFSSSNASFQYYYLKKGVAITLSHKVKDGAIEFNEDELISHFIAEGEVKYTSKDGSEVLRAGDSIYFGGLDEDYYLEMLEDSLIFVYQTLGVRENSNFDKAVMDQLDELEKRDHYTKTHCHHVSEYSAKISMVLGLQKSSFLADLAQASSRHDVGKIRTPDFIPLKPAHLTDDEYSIIKKHPKDDYDILKEAGIGGDILTYVVQHHERLDGSGYPNSLTDNQISDGAKILMVADCFDAMTTNRCYRNMYSEDEAMEKIQKEAKEGKLDTDVVAALEHCLDKKIINVCYTK